MVQEIEKKIKSVVSDKAYDDGMLIDEDNIILLNNFEDVYNFIVKEDKNKPYIVKIVISNNNIDFTECSCDEYYDYGSCKHIAGCLITYSTKVFEYQNEFDVISRTNKLFSMYNNIPKKCKIKKECFLELTIGFEERYYYQYRKEYFIKLKIGTDKMYSITQKFNAFKTVYYNEVDDFELGKNFIFSNDEYYFNEINRKILDFIFSNCENHYNNIYITEKDLKRLLYISKNVSFYLDSFGFVSKIYNEFPFDASLEKNNDNYSLNIIYSDYSALFDDLEYIYYDNKLFHLSKNMRTFLKELEDLNLDRLVFDDSKFNIFNKNILPLVKSKLSLGTGVDNLNLDITPITNIYFDYDNDVITAKLEFLYGDDIILYDVVNNDNIIRDFEYEDRVAVDLVMHGFSFTNNEFVLTDLDKLVLFIESGIIELNEKYNVYTTKKIKNTKILKNVSGRTSFSIGKDNILSYDFNLDGIDKNEYNNIISSLRLKKKYYRLNDGNVIDLNQDSIKQMNGLLEDLELDDFDGTIPKYRAIYLDYLKKEKYNIIDTDNMFDDFINNFNEYKNSGVVFNSEENKILRDYQKDGIKWLYNLTKCDLGGILADEMGLGKSIQTIIYIKKLLDEDINYKFLIVVPTSLIYNWQNEFNKFAPDINIELVNGSRNDREEILNDFDKTVYITTYGLARIDIDLYNDKEFRVCIIDEAQNIKNPAAGITKAVKDINSKTRIALTGTPIENSTLELWSIFDFIMPGLLNSKSKFKNRFTITDFNDESDKIISSLNKQVHPFILRRKKKDVLKDLPPKIENNIYVELNDEQKKVYANEVKLINEQMDELIKENGFSNSKFMILTLLTRLRQLCIDPRIVYDNYTGGSSKIDNLIKAIEEIVLNGHKILLFTSFKTALNIVKDELDNCNISSYVIDGSVSSAKRQELVDSFNNDDTNVFLIMLKSGGTGLNLTSADVVIHLDLWWNPQAENQATDRTHRIGQTNTVEVIKIITKGTIEEKIAVLQEKKKLLSDKIIDSSDNAGFETLSENDIRLLLSFDYNG